MSSLLQAAHATKASTERLLLVTAFNILGWTGICLRTEFKAFRPMDCETFDLVSPELGVTFLTECVRHTDKASSNLADYSQYLNDFLACPFNKMLQ